MGVWQNKTVVSVAKKKTLRACLLRPESLLKKFIKSDETD